MLVGAGTEGAAYAPSVVLCIEDDVVLTEVRDTLHVLVAKENLHYRIKQQYFNVIFIIDNVGSASAYEKDA